MSLGRRREISHRECRSINDNTLTWCCTSNLTNPSHPSFPRKPESTPPVIPTQVGIHPTHHPPASRNPHAGRNPPHPSFWRRPESTPPVIPAGIHPARHSRASRNPPRPSSPRKPESTPPVIPTQAGIHPARHSHAGRNPPYPSFPRKPESTPPIIPTKAGILNSIARPQSVTPADSVPYHSERSEESGNSNLPPGAAIRIRSRIPEFFFRIPRAFPNPPRRRGHAGRAAYLVRARMRMWV